MNHKHFRIMSVVMMLYKFNTVFFSNKSVRPIYRLGIRPLGRWYYYASKVGKNRMLFMMFHILNKIYYESVLCAKLPTLRNHKIENVVHNKSNVLCYLKKCCLFVCPAFFFSVLDRVPISRVDIDYGILVVLLDF